jgi:hypothetical protein
VIHLLRFYVIMFLEADEFREILDWLILVVYTVVTFAFIPLFVTIMTLLEVSLPEIYQRTKCQLITIFTILIVSLSLRLYLFADMKFLHLLFSSTTIYSAIPFYATELVIALSLSYVMYVSAPMEREST